MDFIELTLRGAARGQKTRAMAALSALSFMGVEVPWALT